jgi:hypothetical protein
MKEEIVVILKIIGPKQEWKSEDEIAENFKECVLDALGFPPTVEVTATLVSYKEIE